MPTFYNDKTWQLFDPATGKVRVTDTKEACAGAARPNVDPIYQNHCVQCQLDDMDHTTEQTYVIPVTPSDKWFAGWLGRNSVGVALNGVRIDAPAPVDAILGAHTLAPFDDCGGHFNLHVGYHYHAPSDCYIIP